jgi:hypothetical protein
LKADFLEEGESERRRGEAEEKEEECLEEGEKRLYKASFQDLESNFLNYETLQWVIISLLLLLACGIGAILLLYTPIRRYLMRIEFRSRELYVTSEAIIYKV